MEQFCVVRCRTDLAECEKYVFAAYFEGLAKFMEDTDIGSSIPFLTILVDREGNCGRHGGNYKRSYHLLLLSN